MSMNSPTDGKVWNVVLAAAAVSGRIMLAGATAVVPRTDGAIGQMIACDSEGEFELPKVSAQAQVQGNLAYIDFTTPTAPLLTNTSNSGANTLAGKFSRAAANPSATGFVSLLP